MMVPMEMMQAMMKGKGKGKGKQAGLSPRAAAAATTIAQQRSTRPTRRAKPYDPDDDELEPLDEPELNNNEQSRRRSRGSDSPTVAPTSSKTFVTNPTASTISTTTVVVSPKTEQPPTTSSMSTSTTTTTSHHDEDDMLDAVEDNEDGGIDNVDADGADSHPSSVTMPEVGWRSARKRRPSLKVMMTQNDESVPKGIVKRPYVMASDACSPSIQPTPLLGSAVGGMKVATKPSAPSRRSSIPSDMLNPILNSPSLAMIGDVATPVSAIAAGGFLNEPSQFFGWN